MRNSLGSTRQALSSDGASKLIFSNFLAGSISTLCGIQSEFYARVWGFDHRYESVVSSGVSEFLSRYDKNEDFVRLVLEEGEVVGGIAIDHRDGVLGQLRWFILCDHLRGAGAGKKLFSEAMTFIQKKKFKQVYLTTFQGLDSARRMYELGGFKLTEEKTASTWGKEITEQRFDWYADN
jgi:N-acetylglutamate synthase-like GNAT family acetyltransferase